MGRKGGEEEEEEERRRRDLLCFILTHAAAPIFPLPVSPKTHFTLPPSLTPSFPPSPDPKDLRHRSHGLGPTTFAAVPDEALVHTFLFLLDAATLARLSRCSRAWYCYAHAYTDVWKGLVLNMLAER